MVMTFMIMAAVVVIVVTLLFTVSKRTRGTGFDVVSHQALWLTEAGIQDVICQLRTDAGYRSNPTPVGGSLGEGTYAVTVTRNDDIYALDAKGTVDVITRQITQTLVVSVVPEGFNYAIYADGNIQTAFATNLTITGNQLEGGTNFPTVDFGLYQTLASPGQDISENYTFTSGTYSGIWHIDGNVTIESNVTINGSIITTKKITATRESDITVNPTSPYPALVADDAISFGRSEDISIDGLIYAGADGSGAFDLGRAEGVDITGTIISGGNTDLSRSDGVTITYNSDIISNPPPGITGGGTDASVDPQADWNEL